MTNGEKFKTAKERAAAFTKFCYQKQRTNSRCCEYHGENHCPICTMTWLDLEAESEKPLPCPFCGSRTRVEDCVIGHNVRCTFCSYESQERALSADAIAAHNRVAKAVAKAAGEEAAR